MPAIPEIQGFGSPYMPDGTEKNALLLEMEKLGQDRLSKVQQLLVTEFYRMQRPANTPQFRLIRHDLNAQTFNFRRGEYRNGMFIAIWGTAKSSRDMCAFCSRPDVGTFEQCIVLNGYADNSCANCTYAGKEPRNKCKHRTTNKDFASNAANKGRHSQGVSAEEEDNDVDNGLSVTTTGLADNREIYKEILGHMQTKLKESTEMLAAFEQEFKTLSKKIHEDIEKTRL